jgi:hypothetical protein
LQNRFPAKGARPAQMRSVILRDIALAGLALALIGAFGLRAWLLVQLQVLWLAGLAGIWLFTCSTNTQAPIRPMTTHGVSWRRDSREVPGTGFPLSSNGSRGISVFIMPTTSSPPYRIIAWPPGVVPRGIARRLPAQVTTRPAARSSAK